MMKYELFKEIVAEQFQQNMPKEFENHEIRIEQVDKVNQTLDGLTMIAPDSMGRTASPTIYINYMYEDYQKSGDLQATLKHAARTMKAAFGDIPKDLDSFDLKAMNERVVMMLVNTEQNKEMLKDVPHRDFQDLSIVYKVALDIGRGGMQSVAVKNHIAAYMGMSEEQLFKAAVENTKRLLPPVIKNMNEIMLEVFEHQGMPREVAEMMIGDIPPNMSMYVITNEAKLNGAASMLYEEGLHNLAESLETDLYIMPSSIHEVIAVPATMGDPNELAQMVAEINMDQVSLEERLSNQVYHYDKDLRKLSLATDTPNKRLDGIVAEPPMIYEAKEQSR